MAETMAAAVAASGSSAFAFAPVWAAGRAMPPTLALDMASGAQGAEERGREREGEKDGKREEEEKEQTANG